jgi:hypothetical protein
MFRLKCENTEGALTKHALIFGTLVNLVARRFVIPTKEESGFKNTSVLIQIPPSSE